MERNIDPTAKQGMRIRMQMMVDDRPVSSGMEGTIKWIDSLGTLHVKWDNGRTLGVIPNEDKYELLPSEEDQIDFDVFENSAERLAKKISKKPISGSIDKTFKKAYTKNDLKAESENDSEIDYDEILELMKEKGWGDGVSNHIEGFESSDYYPARSIYSTNEDPTMNYLETFHKYMQDLSTGNNEIEETTTAGAAGAYNAPLFGKPTTIKKPKTKKTSSKIVTKGDLKNPLGKIYSFKPKTESKVFKIGDLLSEISSTHASKLRAAEGTYDGDPWVGKKGWLRKDELTWEGGEIADIMAKLNINWNDSDLTLTDMETDAINEISIFKRKKEIESFQDYDAYIEGNDSQYVVSEKGDEYLISVRGEFGDEYVIKSYSKNEKSLDDVLKIAKDKSNQDKFGTEPKHFTHNIEESKKKKVKKKKEKEEDLEEATTFNSVFGSGFPVTPFMFAKKGKHIPSKKPIWKGGKIVQKADKADLLGESNKKFSKSTLLDEINKVKWVKGGKYVKIKDRCAKYNNKPWCSQGAIDNPLELSDTVFENIEKISKKTGISEEKIYDKIKAKLNGVSKEQIDYNKEHGLPIWWRGTKEGFYEKMEPRNNNTGSN